MKIRIMLRALTKKDLMKTLTWHNQEDIQKFYSGHPFPVNEEFESAWYDKILTSNFPTTVFGIELIEENLLIGITMLKGINMINRSAEFAAYLGDIKHRGKGYSYEASKETLDFGFNKLGLNRIFLRVLEENKTAINLYKKLGFLEEGFLKDSIYKNGSYHNEYIFALLKKDINE